LFDRKLLLLAVFLVAGASAQELKVAAAADLSAALQKIGPAFEKQTGIHISTSLGSSGNFFSQIQNGAPFDVFLSADLSYPEKLQEENRAEPGSLVRYARGRLVVWVPNSSTIKIERDDISSLKSPSVSKISIANPEHAPYGRAAVAALVHYKLYDKVKSKLVMGENVSQAAQFAQSGNADVALIALSLAVSDSMAGKGRYVVLAQESYPPLVQAGVVVNSSKNKQQAQRFLDFLISADAQKVLRQYGFEAIAK
jgi:molybdate transport system substrate-binding protein